mmetsp:Transcript_113481/g.331618  ORF Transcript_113481/g.331618 Transcript_113481/m.331618 type:complete len:234 (-) Transcript_113481:321-1022(-)
MSEWGYQGNMYQTCAETPDTENSWCYVQGGSNCNLYRNSTIDGEDRKWRECGDLAGGDLAGDLTSISFGLSLEVTNAADFVADPRVKAALEAEMASDLGVEASNVRATLYLARRLSQRHLTSATVGVDFLVSIPGPADASSTASQNVLSRVQELQRNVGRLGRDLSTAVNTATSGSFEVIVRETTAVVVRTPANQGTNNNNGNGNDDDVSRTVGGPGGPGLILMLAIMMAASA